MSFKKLFQASFEESLNLQDDTFSGNFARKNMGEAEEKEKYRGTTRSYVWLTVLTILCVWLPSWLIVFLNNYFYSKPDKSDFTVSIGDFNFLPYWVFWVLLSIWVFLIIFGKVLIQNFILIYRGQFHILVTYLFWLVLELNLFFLTMFYETLTFWGVFVFVALNVLIIFYILRSRILSLMELLYKRVVKKTWVDRCIAKIIAFIIKYGWIMVSVWLILRFFSEVSRRLELELG